MKRNRLTAVLTAAVMFAASAAPVFAAQAGESLKVGNYPESAAATQAMIDARPDVQRPMEKLGRGAVAVKMDGYVYLSWR